jgi:hypothetical protein
MIPDPFVRVSWRDGSPSQQMAGRSTSFVKAQSLAYAHRTGTRTRRSRKSALGRPRALKDVAFVPSLARQHMELKFVKIARAGRVSWTRLRHFVVSKQSGCEKWRQLDREWPRSAQSTGQSRWRGGCPLYVGGSANGGNSQDFQGIQ